MQASGISSLAIWTPFNSECTATTRHLAAKCLIAWTRNEIVNAFAIVGTSIIGGTDIVQGVGDNVINDADLYQYFDETDRLIHLEYERHLIEPLGGAAVGMATIVLDNTDLKLSPNHDSTIGTAIKPNRPIKLFVGFNVNGQEVLIPIIEALSLQPKEDKINRTVTIQAEDFVTYLDNIPQETTIYVKNRTDQIIADILARAGIGSSNYVLDQGLNTPAFVGFGVGDFAGISIQNLCQAEEGVFYQDEKGQFRFETRLKYNFPPYTQVQWTIEPDDIIEWVAQDTSQIINHIIVSGQPRSVKGIVQVWNDGQEEVVKPGQTITITAQFNDPVTTLQAPEATLDYQAFTATNGGGSDITGSLTISITSFTTTAQIQITNHNANDAYLHLLALRGTPATVDYQISEVYEDGISVDKYNEQDQTIQNDYIQNSTFAQQLAQDIVNRYKDPQDILQLRIRGVPQLQLRDRIQVFDPDNQVYTQYRIIGIAGILDGGSFVQTLTLRLITANEAF